MPLKNSLSSFLVGSFRYWKAAVRSPQSLLFTRLNNPNSLSLSSQERCSSPQHFSGPPLDPLQQLYVFPVLGAPELDAGLQMVSHQSGAEEQNPLPQPVGHAAFDAAQDAVGLLGCEHTLPDARKLFIFVVIHTQCKLFPKIPGFLRFAKTAC